MAGRSTDLGKVLERKRDVETKRQLDRVNNKNHEQGLVAQLVDYKVEAP